MSALLRSLVAFMIFQGLPFSGPGPTGPRNGGAVSSPIAASRSIDWSSTNPGVVGGIPTRSTICATLSSGATAASINSAIASCPSGEVVYLNPGSYSLSAGIDFGGHSNVTLRGAGPTSTIISFTSDGASCNGLDADVCVAGSNNYQGSPQNTANWSAGYAKGTTSITLSSVTNLHVGTNILILDQADDGADNGSVFVCAVQNTCSTEGPAGGGRSGRAQEQLVQVTSVSGSGPYTVGITPGLYFSNWVSTKSPGAWWGTTTVSGDGIEDLSLNDSASASASGISFYGAYNCWVKNVTSIYSNRNHIWMLETVHVTVRDSYFYGTKNSSSQSYGVEMYMAGDNLVENNIFQHVTAPLVWNGSAAGNVAGYNFTTDCYVAGTNWMSFSAWLHGASDQMDLFEGNQFNGFTGDPIHGTHDFETLFRNRLIGWETTKTDQTQAINESNFSRYFNLVGNVLGDPGYHTQYADLSPSGTNPQLSIYVLGWANTNGRTFGAYGPDSMVYTTLLRWGNYDVVNGAVQWNTAEVPSGIAGYPNPIPPNHNLPVSLFLSARPSWWVTPYGTPPWPPIGPDVSGGTGPGGHSYDIPAALCFENTSSSGGILNFNASNCYSGD